MALAQFAVGKEPTIAMRAPQEPVIPSETESRIWPLEVGLVFNQVEGVDVLSEVQQNKLKANINQLWLERTATSEIITAASELVRNMRGEAA